MLGSGLMDSVMVLEFILVKMEAVKPGSLSGVSNMVWVITISEMWMHMLESILRIRCMVLEYNILEMDIDMKERGMRVRGKDLAFTLSELGKLSLLTGRMGFLMFHLVLAPSPDLLPQSTILKCFMQSRKRDKLLRKLSM